MSGEGTDLQFNFFFLAAKVYHPNIIFILITWEVHTMHSDHIHYPFLPGPPSHTRTTVPKRNNIASIICVAYMLIGAWSSSQRPSP